MWVGPTWWLLGVSNVTVPFQVEIATQNVQRTCTDSLSPSFGLRERLKHWHQGHGSIIPRDRADSWLQCNHCRTRQTQDNSVARKACTDPSRRTTPREDYKIRRLALTNRQMATAEIRADIIGRVSPQHSQEQITGSWKGLHHEKIIGYVDCL